MEGNPTTRQPRAKLNAEATAIPRTNRAGLARGAAFARRASLTWRTFLFDGTGRTGRGRCGFHRLDHVILAFGARCDRFTLGTRGALAATAAPLATFRRCATFATSTAAARTLFLSPSLGGGQVGERRAKPVDLADDQLFDVVDCALVGARDDCIGDATAARAAGAADAVDVILCM
jgi:hypothetical protein